MRQITHKALTALMLAAALVFAAPGSPQNSGAPKTAPPQVPLRASTHLVQINVVVQDKKGNPVTDLTKNDFTIFDQGKPQAIGVFSMEATRIQPAPAKPPDPNVYSDRIEEQAGVPSSVTVILIDTLNTQFSDMAIARKQLAKFVKEMQPQDHVAIYGLTTQLTVLHDFTNDSASLLATLNRTPVRESPQATASNFQPANGGSFTPDLSIANSSATGPNGPPQDANSGAPANVSPDALTLQPTMEGAAEKFDGFLDKSNQQIADFYTANRADITAKALEAIATHIAPLPGRKNLVWVSGGFPIDIAMGEIGYIYSIRGQRPFSEAVERAARALNDSNVAIYPIDARGAITVPEAMQASSQGMRGFTSHPMPIVPDVMPDQKIYDSMNMLADRTGGRAYYGNNDIQGSIRHAIDDARVTYVLGYYPDHGQWNGKFREIKVKLNRSGTNIRYRRGYFAVPDAPPADEKGAAALLLDAANSPISASTLGMTVTTKAEDVPGAPTLKTTMKLEERDILLNQMDGRWVGALDFLFVQVDGHDKIVGSVERRIELNLMQDTYEKNQREGLTFPWDFRIVPGARELRMVARDSISGTTGSVIIPLLKLFPRLSAN